ncbi:MAG: class I SAM-dependent methyltransferase, partial [Verrucomicrobia bacterium]|nr:class I SAM-dependent methyltransferase [Verrucomicrobiota bacterium]
MDKRTDKKFFDEDGFYQFVVSSNVLLHKEAVEFGRTAVDSLIRRIEPKQDLEILDLACGGSPVIINEIMSGFPDVSFRYTGIDINPGQVKSASSVFQFSDNVLQKCIIEGNAWDFPESVSRSKYHLIFTGLNLHHGTPSELFVLFKQALQVLRPDGIFLNHDLYRPADRIYVHRPDQNPNDETESYLMIPQSVVESSGPPNFEFGGVSLDRIGEDDWRLDLLEKLRRILSNRGGDEVGINEACAHMYAKDFALST